MKRAVLLLIGLLLGCAPGGPVLDVTVIDIPEGTQEFLVQIGIEGRAQDLDRQAPNRGGGFRVALPADTVGRVTLEVDAMGERGCALASGQVEREVPGAGTYEVTVALAPLRCEVAVRRRGDGEGSVKIAVQGAQIQTCSDWGVPCTSELDRGGLEVTLEAAPRAGSVFLGWIGCDEGADGTRCVLRPRRRTEIGVRFLSESWCSPEKFCWENPLPQGDSLNQILALAYNDVWALGGAGSVLRYDGTVWYRVESGVRGQLHGIAAVGRDDVWIVGEDGVVLRWQGLRLEPVSDLRSKDVTWYGVLGNGPEDLWIVGCPKDDPNSGVVLRREQGIFHRSSFSACLRAVRRVGPEVWAVGGDAQGEAAAVWRDGKFALLPRSGKAGALLDLWGAAPDDVWAVNVQRGVVRWDGAGWSLGRSAALRSIWGSGPADIWAVGDFENISRFDGERWTWLRQGPSLFTSVSGSDARDVWIAGATGTLLHFDGVAISEHSRGRRLNINRVLRTASGMVWAVGEKGTVMRRQGRAWEEIRSDFIPVTEDLHGLWSEGTELWAVGGSGAIYRWKEPNEGWAYTRATGQPAPTLRAIAALGGDLWIAGPENGVLRLPGRSLEQPPEQVAVSGAPGKLVFVDIGVSGPEELILVGHAVDMNGKLAYPGAVLRLNIKDRSQRLTLLNDGLPLAVSPDGAWAAGINTDNTGRIWRWDGTRFVGESQPDWPQLFGMWSSGGAAWAVGGGGAVLRHEGGAWQRVQSGASSRLQAVHGGPDGLWVAGWFGQILHLAPEAR